MEVMKLTVVAVMVTVAVGGCYGAGGDGGDGNGGGWNISCAGNLVAMARAVLCNLVPNTKKGVEHEIYFTQIYLRI